MNDKKVIEEFRKKFVFGRYTFHFINKPLHGKGNAIFVPVNVQKFILKALSNQRKEIRKMVEGKKGIKDTAFPPYPTYVRKSDILSDNLLND